MSYIDLQSVLKEWPYEPDKISVRKILGADNVVRIQMRVELGILQLETRGRPDGAHPHGCDSLVTYHRQRLATHEQRNGTALGFGLSGDEARELRIEASLLYRRYVAWFVLEDYDEVVGDTSRSLTIFDLCGDHALEAEDRLALEEFRPYVLMMGARALAYQAIQDKEPASALAHVNRGIMQVKDHYERHEEPDADGSSEELKILRGLAKDLSPSVPSDSLIVTRKALREAIAQERFEDAARLRDALNEHPHHEGDSLSSA